MLYPFSADVLRYPRFTLAPQRGVRGDRNGSPGRYPLYLGITLLWLALSAVLCAIIIGFDLARARADFQRHGADVFDYVSNRVETAITVLDGFAALLASNGHAVQDRQQVAAYADQMLRRYAHLYMLEIAVQVRQEDLARFVAEQRGAGLTDFSVKAFDFVGSRGWVALDAKADYYPIVFMRPALPEAREVMGLDIGSNGYFLQALEASATLRRPVASYPFQLVEQGQAFLMHNAVLSTGGGGASVYALLVVKAASLLPAWSPRDGERVRLHHADFDAADPRGLLGELTGLPVSGFSRWLFPRLVYSRLLPDPGHPYVLQAERQLTWADLNRPLLGLTVLGSLLSFALLLFYARVHHQQQLQRLLEANRLFQLANYDSLTGLPNRNLLLDRLQQAQQRAYRQDIRLAILFVDLDKFKLINDTFGHEGGDAVLRLVARRLRECARDSDTLARIGGDEFVLLLEDCDEGEALRVVKKIEEAFAPAFSLHGKAIYLNASVGLAHYPRDGTEIRQLLRHADGEMYAQKLRQRCVN